MVGFRGRNEAFNETDPEPEVCATGVNFDPARGKLLIALSHGGVMAFDPATEPALRDLTSEQLSGLMLGFAGAYLHQPDLDLNMSIRHIINARGR